jgi:hypothetical protein
MIETVSGCHPFRPQHLIDELADYYSSECPEDPEYVREEFAVPEAEGLIRAIDRGECPRCGGPLADAEHPGWDPAGSRMTDCRCIPICSTCGFDEATWPGVRYPRMDGSGTYFYAQSVGSWPYQGVAERVADRRANAVTGFLSIGADGNTDTVVTPGGAGPVVWRDHPGGWLEFGYDGTDDEAEVKR